MAHLPFEPYKIKMVEPITQSTKRQRRRWIGAAHYNLFALSSDQVMVDMLTDSGTGAMSDRQWAALMQGDESYAGSRSFAQLKQVVENITGFPHLIPTHQGRGAENVLFSVLVHKNDWVPGNAHFDTTKGHIEWRKAQAIDCTVAEAYDPSHMAPFKGNIDLEKLEATYQQAQTEKRTIPLVVLTLTCNSVGGQPVSMANIKAVSEWCQSKEIPLILDAARLAENAYFIKKREEGFQQKSIKSIVRQMCGHAQGMTMSAKKDGLANMGGFVALHDEKLYERCNTYTIIFEGFLTYGGLSGRDMSALAVGLDEATEQNYLHHRVGQVAYLGQRLADYGVPVQQPFGGHAVYIDADDFVPNISREEFRAQALAVELYIEAGIRGVEIGTLLADRDPLSGNNRFPKREFVRLAIPRRVYTQSHLDYVAESVKKVYDTRNDAQRGYAINWEAPIMRHFTVKLQKIKSL
jgi:tryptophanase